MQFDGEPGEMAKDACAEFCNHQKFALEQLKVSKITAQLLNLKDIMLTIVAPGS